MSNDEIYAVLASKPHNPHYLKRYFKFILSCKIIGVEYSEIHHICPKAKDLFPEYKILKYNKWNAKRLTARQHFIAHLILSEVYGGSQSHAFLLMSRTLIKKCKDVKIKLRLSRFYEKARKIFSKNRIGKACYKNKEGSIVGFIPVNDDRVISGEYTHINSGLSVYRNKCGESEQMSPNDSRVLSGEYTHSNKGRISILSSDRQRGTACYKNKDGQNVGRLSTLDPRVVSGEFISISAGRKINDEFKNTIHGMALYRDLIGNNMGRQHHNHPMVLSGEWIGLNLGKLAYMDKNGVYVGRLLPDHPMILSGEYIRKMYVRKPRPLIV